jgi:hypothetical protein
MNELELSQDQATQAPQQVTAPQQGNLQDNLADKLQDPLAKSNQGVAPKLGAAAPNREGPPPEDGIHGSGQALPRLIGAPLPPVLGAASDAVGQQTGAPMPAVIGAANGAGAAATQSTDAPAGGGVSVAAQEIDIAGLSDEGKQENQKVPLLSSFADPTQQQAYAYMAWVAEYEQKESIVHFFEKKEQSQKETILDEAVAAEVIPKNKKTPAQEQKEEADAKAAELAKALADQERAAAEEKAAKEKETKWYQKAWGGLKRGAKAVASGVASAVGTVAKGAWEGLKSAGSAIASGASAVAKVAGYEKVKWGKLTAIMRSVAEAKAQGKNGKGAAKELKEDPSILNDVHAGLSGANSAGDALNDLAGGKASTVIEGNVHKLSVGKQVKAVDGVDTRGAANAAALGFSSMGAGLGLIGDASEAYANFKGLKNDDHDGFTKGAHGLGVMKNLSEASNHVATGTRAIADLSAGSTGAVMTAAQLGMALGVGQIVGGTAELVKGILDIVSGEQGKKKLNALKEKLGKLEDAVPPKMLGAVWTALESAEGRTMAGISEVISGSTAIVGGALLLALGISNPIGAIVVGVGAAIGGIIAAYKWKKAADAQRKLIDEHPTFKGPIADLTDRYKKDTASYEEKVTAYKEKNGALTRAANSLSGKGGAPKPSPFVSYIDERTGVGDSAKGKIAGGKDNDGTKEAIRRIVLQEHGFVDTADYQLFHNETLSKYLHGVLVQGDPQHVEDPALKAEIDSAATVVASLGLKAAWEGGKLTNPKSPESIQGKL